MRFYLFEYTITKFPKKGNRPIDLFSIEDGSCHFKTFTPLGSSSTSAFRIDGKTISIDFKRTPGLFIHPAAHRIVDGMTYPSDGLTPVTDVNVIINIVSSPNLSFPTRHLLLKGF